jgi:hypothetical protein
LKMRVTCVCFYVYFQKFMVFCFLFLAGNTCSFTIIGLYG